MAKAEVTSIKLLATEDALCPPGKTGKSETNKPATIIPLIIILRECVAKRFGLVFNVIDGERRIEEIHQEIVSNLKTLTKEARYVGF